MVSVGCLILNYNDARLTKKMVDKIINYNIFKNIIIVDNLSTDDSFEYLQRCFHSNSKVIVLNSQKNGGYGYGNNFGIKYAWDVLHDEYIVVSNPDVSFSEQMVEKLVKLMIKKNAAITSAQQHISNSGYVSPAWKIPTAFQWAFEETRFFKKYTSKFYYPKSYFKYTYSKVDCVRGAMFLLDIRKFLSVGGYDEKMFLFGEETVIGYKFLKKGYSTYVLNSEYYIHDHSVTIKKNIPSLIKKERILQNSKILFMKKYLQVNSVQLLIIEILFKLKLLKMKFENMISR